jgi:phospholipid transport system substrate-binding protein
MNRTHAIRALTMAAALLGAFASGRPAGAGAGDEGTGAKPAEIRPADVVSRLQEALLAAMKDAATVDFAERRERLRPVITSTHDLDFVSRTVLRKYWEQLTQPQRSKFTETFCDLCVATYADRFDDYSGQRFEPVGEQELKRGSVLVRTRLIRPGKDPVQLDYVLARLNDRWMIVNVVADGVSDLAVKRVEYGSVMEKEGFEDLLGRLKEKVASLPSP